MRRFASIVGGLTAVVVFPVATSLLQGCLGCGSDQAFDLLDGEGT